MGVRGPVPSRSETRRRRNKPEDGVDIESVDSDDFTAVWGDPDPDWHPLMRDAYEALQNSPQSVYSTQADIAQARITFHVWSGQLNRSGGPSGQALSALFSSLDSLLMTEGARRRLKIEVGKMNAQEDAPVIDLVDRRSRLASSD